MSVLATGNYTYKPPLLHPPLPPPPPSCWITLEKFFVFGIVAQLGWQAEHGLGNGALGESTARSALATMLEIKRSLSMAPVGQAGKESTSEGASRGCTAARISTLNGAFANRGVFFRLVVLTKNGSAGAPLRLASCRALRGSCVIVF